VTPDAAALMQTRRRISPQFFLAHQVYSRYLVTRGRIDEGIAEIETAIDLDPKSRFNPLVWKP
jgi:hypothetical protein